MVVKAAASFLIWADMLVMASSTVGVDLAPEPEPAMVNNGWEWVGKEIAAVVMSGSGYQNDMAQGIRAAMDRKINPKPQGQDLLLA
jgi:hypothetical protein